MIGAAFLTFNAVFQHANLNTPRWLGLLIQRPEGHSLHHGRGVHAYNYADLSLIDMMFGTFCNPVQHRAQVGFRPGASARLGAMLMGRDVSRETRRTTVNRPTVLAGSPECLAGTGGFASMHGRPLPA